MAVVMTDGSIRYAGRVLGTGSTYLGDGDGWDYVVVWDDDADGPKHLTYRSSYGFGNDVHAVKWDIDADDATLAKVVAKDLPRMRDVVRNEMEYKATTMRTGKTVTLVEAHKRGKNKNVAAGTTGACVWLGPNNFVYGSSETARIGVKLDDGTVVWDETYRWTAAADFVVTDAMVEAKALAVIYGWHPTAFAAKKVAVA